MKQILISLPPKWFKLAGKRAKRGGYKNIAVWIAARLENAATRDTNPQYWPDPNCHIIAEAFHGKIKKTL